MAFVVAQEPSYGISTKKTYRVMENSFGDGYTQSVQDGLNNVREEWNLTWDNVSEDIANSIESQLDSFAGTAFDWLTPKGTTKKFRCKEMNRTFTNFEGYNVTATFEEDFS